jgi:hypothetical protein
MGRPDLRTGTRGLTLLTALVATALVGAFLGGGAPRPAAAQGSGAAGFDLLFMVDQSGSMGGEPYGTAPAIVPVPNDPAGLRFIAPEAAVRILALDRLSVRRQADYRVGLLSFGSSVETTLPMTPLNLAKDSEWDALAGVVLPPIGAPAWAGRNLGETDFVQPFNRACSLIPGAGAGAARPRVLVVVTDGQPAGATVASVPAHMAQVRDIVRSCLDGPGFRLYVVAMKDLRNPQYWDGVRATWEEIAGDPARVSLVNSNEQVHQRIGAILLDLIPWGERVAQQTVVLPYLENVTFRFFKTRPDDQVLLFPDGAAEAINAACAAPVTCPGRSDLLETVTIPFPRPGIWRIEVARGRDLEVWKTQILPTVAAKGPPQITQFAPADIEINLLTTQGALVPDPQDAAYRLNWTESRVVVGDQVVPLEVAGKDGVYKAQIRPQTIGPAEVRLIGRTNGYGPDGRPAQVTVVEQVTRLVNVVAGTVVRAQVDASPVDAAGNSPIHRLPLWLGPLEDTLNRQPVRFRVRLQRTADAAPVAGAEAFGAAGDSLELVVTGGASGEMVQPMTVSGDGWEATAGLPALGSYAITPRLRAPLRPGYALDAVAPLQLQRVETPGRDVGQAVEIGVAGLLAALAAWWGVNELNRHRRPHLIGRLEITDAGGRTVQTLPLRRNVNRQRFSGGQLRRESQVAWLRVHCVTAVSRGGPRRGAPPAPAQVEVSLKTRGGGTLTPRRLTSGGTAPLPGAGGQVRYRVS